MMRWTKVAAKGFVVPGHAKANFRDTVSFKNLKSLRTSPGWRAADPVEV